MQLWEGSLWGLSTWLLERVLGYPSRWVSQGTSHNWLLKFHAIVLHLNFTFENLLFSLTFFSHNSFSLSLFLFLAISYIIWKYKKYLVIFHTSQMPKNVSRTIFRVAKNQRKIATFSQKKKKSFTRKQTRSKIWSTLKFCLSIWKGLNFIF
jgi:hypothetical protein